MASLDDSVTSLLKRSYPSADLASAEPHKISTSIFPDAQYSDAEKAEIDQWTITANHIVSPNEDAAKSAERLSSLNTHLSTRTTVLGSKPSVADIALYTRLAPEVSKWSPEQRTGEQGHHHVVRHVDFVQNAPVFGLQLSDGAKVTVKQDDVVSPIKPIDVKAEKERKKKEKEAAASAGAASAAAAGATVTDAAPDAAKKSKKEKAKDKLASAGEVVASAVGASHPGPKEGQKTEKKKKEKAPKPPPAPKEEKPLSPSLIDLRVGHILKAEHHPNADSLYVSTIACGDPAGTDNTSEYEGQVVRTVCSGLNGLIPLDEMRGSKIVAVCNLKPVTMRGVKSCAMVLAASPRPKEGDAADDGHKGPVELVRPPEASAAGQRVYFEGWEGEPEKVLNPKKKVWETVQPGFTTTDDLEPVFNAGAVEALKEKTDGKGLGVLRTKEGTCKVKTLKGAAIR